MKKLNLAILVYEFYKIFVWDKLFNCHKELMTQVNKKNLKGKGNEK